jgi:hypothetical protein
MKHRDVAVILATGGMGLVRAAYSAGKPAYGVGPGNAPCYIEQSADLAKAASDIVLGKSFDSGVLCSSPNSVVVDRAVADEVRRQFVSQGAYFLAPAGPIASRPRSSPQRLRIRSSSARPRHSSPPSQIDVTVPAGTRVLIAGSKVWAAISRFRSALPGPFLHWWPTGARGVDVIRSSDMEDGARCRSTRGTTTSSFSSG